MGEPVLFVRNRWGALHTVTKSHFEAFRERDGLVEVDERAWLLTHHQRPAGQTIRANAIPEDGAGSTVADQVLEDQPKGEGLPPRKRRSKAPQA